MAEQRSQEQVGLQLDSRRYGSSIGRLRARVELQTAAQTPTASGQLNEAWTTTLTVWADVRPVSMWESSQSMQLQAQISHRVRVRYSSVLVTDFIKGTSKKRVRWGNRIFRIEGHRRRDEVGDWLDLNCVEEV